jgi:acyl carrier protein
MKNLIELVANVLNVPASSLDSQSSPSNQRTWDSLAHITIISAVEATYGVSLTMPEILAIKNIGDLADILKRHGVK